MPPCELRRSTKWGRSSAHCAEHFGLPGHGGTLGADDRNRIEQSIAEKLRSYAVDDIDMAKSTRITLRDRLDAFYRDALSAAASDVDERMRAVATTSLGIPPEVVSTLNAEKQYRAALKHWESYQSWQTQRNPSRAALERAYGYDTKHAMHLIRLMRMGLEVLESGELHVRRDDAEQLLAIRDGALSFDELLAAAGELQQAMESAATGSSLPATSTASASTLCSLKCWQYRERIQGPQRAAP